MADDLTLGELARNQARLESRVERSFKDGDDRITDLASKMVPTELWKSEHKAHDEDIKHLNDDVREGFERIERTSKERMATLRTEIAEVRKAQAAHEKAHESNASWSRNRTLTAIGIAVGAAATIAAAWIAAVLAAKGVH